VTGSQTAANGRRSSGAALDLLSTPGRDLEHRAQKGRVRGADLVRRLRGVGAAIRKDLKRISANHNARDAHHGGAIHRLGVEKLADESARLRRRRRRRRRSALLRRRSARLVLVFINIGTTTEEVVRAR